jgi:hypothetical protein
MQTAVANFRADLSRVEKLALWLTTPEALKVDMAQATWAVRCGAVVLLSGYFESFLRECMSAFIRDLNALNKPISKLPAKIRYTHFENGARALERLVKTEKQAAGVTVKCEDLASRLASVRSANGYTLVAEAFTETKANPGPRVVADLLRAIGVENPWKHLRAAAPKALGDIELFLTTFIELRNECAHSGSTTSPPTASDLDQYCKNFEGMATAVTAVLTQQINALNSL